jgi:hypothetical protein
MSDDVKVNPELESARMRTEIEKMSLELQLNKFQLDSYIYKWVITFLGLSVMLVIGGAIILSFVGPNTLPEGLIAIASAAVGAMAGILAPSSASK